MELVISPVTARRIKSSLPIFVSIQDMLTKTAEISFEIQMENYKRSSFLLFSSESGSKFSLSIKGKPGFCLAALHNLVASAREYARNSTHIDVFKARVNEVSEWQVAAPISDWVKPHEEFSINFTGESYERNSYIVGSSETGPKFAVKIKGAPGFTQLAVAQIQGSAPLLKNMIAVALNGN